MIISPERPRTKITGRVTILGDTVIARYPEKDDDWRATCKRLSYIWENGRWQRRFWTSDKIQHRAAELAHHLLNAGFIIELDDIVAQMVTSASYELESFRNVRTYTSGEYAGWFTVTWPKNEDLYGLVTRLPTSHWDGRSVVVRREYFEEVIDFAELHGFTLSAGAKELADKARREQESIVIVDVPPLPKAPAINDQRPKLTAPEFVRIDQELIDDEYDNSAL